MLPPCGTTAAPRVVAQRAAPPRPRRRFRAARPRASRRGTGRSSRRRSPATTSGSVSTFASPTASRNAASRSPSRSDASSRRCYGRPARRTGGACQYRAVPEQASLRGRLLVATPPLVDPNFDRTVVLMLEHGDDGALGIVLNRPSETDARRRAARVARASSCAPASCSAAGRSSPDAVIALGARRPATPTRGWVPVLGDLGTVDLGRDPLDLGVAARRAARLRRATRAGRRASSKPSSSRTRGSWSTSNPTIRSAPRPSACGATCSAASAGESRCSPTTPKTPTVN